ncbi:MerR family transcriptional regulator [Nonomuraea monospora]|uniref:MerR family transcriptional regulator n=1 Tax=Nonomuraea monospora TaxID=568818 RepID=A0ABN3CAX0_9ACTN
MDGDTLYSIGDLARRTGLTVKTVRFYSDAGIVPPTCRSPAGYRLYDLAAAARLDLVRTLRDLGLDLPTIRKVVDRETSLPQVAAAHAEALAAQIRTLRLRRAVLTAVARRGSTPEEMELMHELARLSENERHRLIGDFLAETFGGLGDGFAGVMTSLTPELPDDPSDEQVEAWIELAELSRDPAFRAAMRRIASDHAADRRAGRAKGRAGGGARDSAGDRVREPVLRPGPAAMARDLAAPALAAGLDPASPEAEPYVAALVTATGEEREALATRLETAGDPRWDRYVHLLAVINAWPPPRPLAPALAWFTEALR